MGPRKGARRPAKGRQRHNLDIACSQRAIHDSGRAPAHTERAHWIFSVASALLAMVRCWPQLGMGPLKTALLRLIYAVSRARTAHPRSLAWAWLV